MPPIKILIVGNGFGGIYALKKLHKIFCGDPKIRIYLVGEKNYFLFTPLLHEVATGNQNPENIVEPIRKVLGCCLNKFYLGKVKNISLEDKKVEVDGIALNYDYLILAPGATTNYYNIPGAEEHSLPLKSLEDATKIKNRSILALEHASNMPPGPARKRALSFVIVGGGATGVELVAEIEELVKETFVHYYPSEIMNDVSITLIQKDDELLPQFSKKLRDKSLKVLRKKGINVMLNTEVKEVSAQEVILKDDKIIPTETVIWVAGIRPSDLKFEKEIIRSLDGRAIVNENLQLEGYKSVFAIGDFTFLKPAGSSRPLPALAQVASKEAGVVAKNIKLLLENKPLKPFVYNTFGSLVSVGQWMAVAEIFGFAFSGRFAWWLWRTVYLFKLISAKKKFRVAIDWTIHLFLPRDISEF